MLFHWMYLCIDERQHLFLRQRLGADDPGHRDVTTHDVGESCMRPTLDTKYVLYMHEILIPVSRGRDRFPL